MLKHFSFCIFVLLLSQTGQLSAQGFLKKIQKAAEKKLSENLTENLTEKGEDMRLKLDSVDFQYAISLNQGAGFFNIEQKGETSSKLLYSIKEASEKTVVEKARDTLEMGIGMYEIRRYEMAEWTIRRMKLLMEREELTEEIVYLRVISNLGLIYMTQGKTSEAEALIAEALEKSENILSKTSPAYIANLNNYAKLRQLNGKYNESEKAFEESLTLSEEVFGGGMQQAIILNNQAMLYQNLGQYDRAVEMMQEAIEASGRAPKKVFQGEKSFDNRKFKANLATVLQTAGRYEEAERLFLELKEIFENRKQTKNAEYAGLVNQLGILYIQMGKTDKVRDMLVTSLDVYRRRWGENNIYYAKVANDLGNFHRMMSQYDQAATWLNKAFDIRKQLLETSHPDYAKTQEDLAVLYWKTGRYQEAYSLYKDVMSKTIDIVNRFFPPMSEAEKTKFWDITSPRFQRFYNFALESYSENPDIILDVFNYNLKTKGLLLSATSKVKNAILKSGNDELIKDYLSWQDMKEQLARLYSYSKGKQKSQQVNLVELEEEANQMEKRLSEQSAEFSVAFAQDNQDFQSLAKQLSANEAIVDVIRVRGFDQDFNENTRYLALITKSGATSPEFVVIENGANLELRISKYYRNAIKNAIDDQLSFKNFWAQVEPKIREKRKIYFSPDGVYNQININTLRLPDNKFMIDQHDLVVIGNSKDVSEVKSRESSSASKNAFLLGYPEYGTPDIPELPGTQQEISNISSILSTGGYQIARHVGDQATESKIKNMQNPQVVHIATHGYFMKDSDASGSVFGVNTDNASNNPLLKSGLILAGTGQEIADTLNTDISSRDNGILTAYEAMSLNLDETDLVVLSACETGLGEVKSGEGVYGLQRAFQVAGADALIMSLWKVSDEATQKLMTRFYNNWIKSGDKQAAFHKAQLELRTEYKEPYYWGAFVMIGG